VTEEPTLADIAQRLDEFSRRDFLKVGTASAVSAVGLPGIGAAGELSAEGVVKAAGAANIEAEVETFIKAVNPLMEYWKDGASSITHLLRIVIGVDQMNMEEFRGGPPQGAVTQLETNISSMESRKATTKKELQEIHGEIATLKLYLGCYERREEPNEQTERRVSKILAAYRQNCVYGVKREGLPGGRHREASPSRLEDVLEAYDAAPKIVKIRGLIRMAEENLRMHKSVLHEIIYPSIRFFRRELVKARNAVNAQEKDVKGAEEPSTAQIPDWMQITHKERKQWVDSVLEKLRRLPKGQKLGLVLDVSIGSLDDHGHELISELENLVEREEFKGRLDIITGSGDELLGKVDAYLRKNKNGIVKGLLHYRDQKNYEKHFSREGFKHRVELVSVDDEKIQHLGSEDSEALTYIPIFALIEASLTGIMELLPYMYIYPAEEGSIISLIVTLQPAPPIGVDELEEKFKEDAEFLRSA